MLEESRSGRSRKETLVLINRLTLNAFIFDNQEPVQLSEEEFSGGFSQVCK